MGWAIACGPTRLAATLPIAFGEQGLYTFSTQLMLDGNSRQDLAAFVSTWVVSEVQQVSELCIDEDE